MMRRLRRGGFGAAGPGPGLSGGDTGTGRIEANGPVMPRSMVVLVRLLMVPDIPCFSPPGSFVRALASPVLRTSITKVRRVLPLNFRVFIQRSASFSPAP
jgi:hypothetical protein